MSGVSTLLDDSVVEYAVKQLKQIGKDTLLVRKL